jgi:hypothetical protein
MQRSQDNGIVVGMYGGIGYYERDGARKSADLFAWARSLARRLMSIFL